MCFSYEMPAIRVFKLLYLLYNKYFGSQPIYLYVLAQYLQRTDCKTEKGPITQKIKRDNPVKNRNKGGPRVRKKVSRKRCKLSDIFTPFFEDFATRYCN
jgi:hypothetical protein